MKKKIFSNYLVHHHNAWFTDADNDGVVDAEDCDPYNPSKQGPLHDKLKSAREKLSNIKQQTDQYSYDRNRELDKLRGFDVYLFVQNRETGRWIRYRKIDRMEYERNPARIDAMIRNIMRNPRWVQYKISDDDYWSDRKNIRDKKIDTMTQNLKDTFTVEQQQTEQLYQPQQKSIFEMERNLVWGKQNRKNSFGFLPYMPVTRNQSFSGKLLKSPYQRGIRAEPFYPKFFDYRQRHKSVDEFDMEEFDEQGF